MKQLTIANQLKKELDALRPLKKEEELRIMQKFRLDWNYHSNHLKGSTLTYGETRALLLEGTTIGGKPLQDILETEGHDEAIEWVMDFVKRKMPLTEHFIRQLHQLILTKKPLYVGKYKDLPNSMTTITGELLTFATPEETQVLMPKLIKWYNNKLNEAIDPIILAAIFHHKFIRIHPFGDGNGRTARLLMNFILLKFGYPPVIIEKEDKDNYLLALNKADTGRLDAFVEYIGKNLNKSLMFMIQETKKNRS